MDLSGKKVLVVGAGISGNAAAKLCKKFGASVTLSDSKHEAELSCDITELRDAGIEIKLGEQTNELLDGVSLIILSPAVPVKIPLVQEAYKRGIDVISELEFAWRLSKSPILAVTGTNGKTTTVTLLGLLMKTAYEHVGVGGNIGIPLCEEVIKAGDNGSVVAEVSSYQLEASKDFHPHIAAILNVTPDHVVRHGSLEVYQQMKEKIFAAQTADDFLVINYDDEKTRSMKERTKSRVCFFSRLKELDEGAYLRSDGMLVIKWDGAEHEILPASDLQIKGAHNIENALAASACAYLGGAKIDDIAKTLAEFGGVEHRIEPVAKVSGVMYYNDSKATNTDSAIKALESFDKHIILIAGGDDKMTDLTDFMTLVKERCDCLILVGNAAARFKEAALSIGFSEAHIHEAGYSMEEAVKIAHNLAEPPQIVLLSPACASFDMFTGFEERGRVFKTLVKDLL